MSGAFLAHLLSLLISRNDLLYRSKRCHFSLLQSRINSDEQCLLLYAGFVQASKPGLAVRLVHNI